MFPVESESVKYFITTVESTVLTFTRRAVAFCLPSRFANDFYFFRGLSSSTHAWHIIAWPLSQLRSDKVPNANVPMYPVIVSQ
jgi:hypothetical protein